MRLDINDAGMEAIMKSAGVRALAEKVGQKIADASNATLDEGAGYEMESGLGRERAHVSVMPTTTHAIRSNAKHNTLVRKMGSGRG